MSAKASAAARRTRTVFVGQEAVPQQQQQQQLCFSAGSVWQQSQQGQQQQQSRQPRQLFGSLSSWGRGLLSIIPNRIWSINSVFCIFELKLRHCSLTRTCF
jgi:hypothetical protein